MLILILSSILSFYLCLYFIRTPGRLLHPKNTQFLLLNHVHRHIVCITHIQPHDIPHHEINASTPDIQHLHLHPVYTIQCIHLYPMSNTTQRVHMLKYHDYMMHIHNTTCPRDNMYDMHQIPHVHQYMHNMYTIPLVHCTTYTTCAQNHMYTVPPAQRVHNAKCTLHHCTMCTQYPTHDVYMTPYVHSITCTMCTHHQMLITPYVQRVHGTTCSQHHLYSHAHNTIRTTCTQHHMYIALHIQHVHNIICTQHYISNMHKAPYVHTPHIHHEDSTICMQHPICNIHTTLFLPSYT